MQCFTQLLTSSTLPVVLSFQQKWIRESSDCWMYTVPLRLSGVTTLPFSVILPARNSTRYLLELPRVPLTMLGKRAPDDIVYTRGRQVGAKEKLDRRPQTNENSRVKHDIQFGTKKGYALEKAIKRRKSSLYCSSG